jgi:thioredoxin 1
LISHATGPCRLIAPKVIAFSQDYPNVDFYKVDVDEVNDVAAELGVRAMPTFFLFKNGEKIGEVVGANPNALKVRNITVPPMYPHFLGAD